MKTTIDFPEDKLQQAKLYALQHHLTLRELVLSGIEMMMKSESDLKIKESALERLHRGFHMKGKPLSRDSIYERRTIS